MRILAKLRMSSGIFAVLASVIGVALGAFVMGQIYVAREGATLHDERMTGIYAQSRLLADAIEAQPVATAQFPAIKQWGLRGQATHFRGAVLNAEGQVVEQANAELPVALADSGFRARISDLASGKQWSIRGGLVSAPDVVFVAQRLQNGNILVIEKSEPSASGYWTMFSTLVVAAVALFWGAVILAWSSLRVRSRRVREFHKFEDALVTVGEQALRRVELQALEAQALLAKESESKPASPAAKEPPQPTL